MYFGIDIGGTNTVIGMVSKEGKLVDKESVKTQNFCNAEDLVLVITESIYRIAHVWDEKIEGIGIGCPSGNHYNGSMDNPVNMPFHGIIPLVKYFRQYFEEIPIILSNDANTAIVGEKVFGHGKNLENFALITLGTGLGSAFIVDNHLLYGHRGMAGEMGHSLVNLEGRPCNCGRKGCLERYVSAGGITQTYMELCEQNETAPLVDNYKDLCSLAAQGDEIALETFNVSGQILGLGLANMATYTAPTHIFLFGGVAQARDLLLEPTRKYFDEYLLENFKGHIQIELSALLNENAAVLGAAALCLPEVASI